MPRKPLSAAHKAAISKALKGKKRGLKGASPEAKAAGRAASDRAEKPKRGINNSKVRAAYGQMKSEIQETADRRGEKVPDMARNARTRITAREDQLRAQVRSEKPARSRSRSQTSATKARSRRLNRGVH